MIHKLVPTSNSIFNSDFNVFFNSSFPFTNPYNERIDERTHFGVIEHLLFIIMNKTRIKIHISSIGVQSD